MAITEHQMERLLEILEHVSADLRNLSHGGTHQGPLGFEALSMAIAGEGAPGSRSLVSVIDSCSSTLAEAISSHGGSVERAGSEIAQSLSELAKAVEKLKS